MATISKIGSISVLLNIIGHIYGLQDQRFIKTPASVTVTEGDNIILPCRVDNIIGALQWTKDDFGLGTRRSLPGYDRYSMLGTDNTTWDLHITSVQISDEGLYQCQILASPESGPLRSEYATLTVVTPPSPPVITSGPRFAAKHGGSALIQCISKGSRPATQIKWKRNGDDITEGIDSKITTLPDLKTMTISTLTFTVTEEMDDDMLTCITQNDVTNDYNTIDTRVVVQTKPILKITVSDSPLYAGDKVTLTCGADGDDDDDDLTDFRWSVAGQNIREVSGSQSLVIIVTRQMHHAIVTCSANNDAGVNKAYHKLNINCKYHVSPKNTPMLLETWGRFLGLPVYIEYAASAW